jgi:predicted negative regulator of RcsB-dependent stress response
MFRLEVTAEEAEANQFATAVAQLLTPDYRCPHTSANMLLYCQQALRVAAEEAEANRFAAAEAQLQQARAEVEAAEGLAGARQVRPLTGCSATECCRHALLAK